MSAELLGWVWDGGGGGSPYISQLRSPCYENALRGVSGYTLAEKIKECQIRKSVFASFPYRRNMSVVVREVGTQSRKWCNCMRIETITGKVERLRVFRTSWRDCCLSGLCHSMLEILKHGKLSPLRKTSRSG